VASSNPPPCTPASAPALAQAAADAIARAGSAMPKDSIQWILVYDANAAGYPQPSGNTTLTCTTNCVKYVWDAGLNKFRYASGSWASASVNACVNQSDSVGVALRANHNWMSGLVGGFMGGDKVRTERTVMKFEPLTQDTCKPGTPNAHN
jgi:hypothetical protein